MTQGGSRGWRGTGRGLLFVSALALSLSASEGVLRLAERLGRLPAASQLVEPDPELGWRLRAGRPALRWTNACGATVTLAPPAGPYLVRRPVAPGATRVLFVGDSHTHAYSVSTGRAYPELVERGSGRGLEAWVAAVSGFGSLQELRLLERVADVARPSVVLWQLSGNDLANNVFELDDASLYNNQRTRPYLDPATGEVAFRDPGVAILDRSHLARRVFAAGMALDGRHRLGWLAWLDRRFAARPADPAAAERRGLDVLALALRQARAALPEARFVGFSADATREEEFARVFEAEGAGFVRGVGAALEAEPHATDCAPHDRHWNDRGHEVVAQTLSAWIDVSLVPPGAASLPPVASGVAEDGEVDPARLESERQGARDVLPHPEVGEARRAS